ncbi:MAG: aminotransferase class III-fold pyridoxal phosphate-dependent enzyme, partial [Saprospiraceae bacterium]
MDLTGPIWYPYTQMQTAREPLKIVSGEGVYIKDDQGVDYIDAISSWWVNIHGHANPAIAKAISEQALILEQVIFAGCTHEPAIKLANELLRKCNMPNGKVYYSDNGSTAVEIAVKMAIQYFYNSDKPRTKILTWENDFHGETFGAMSVSDQGGLNAAFTDLMFETIKIPIPKKPDDEETFDKISKIAAGNDIAAFIFEPLVQGAGGMV